MSPPFSFRAAFPRQSIERIIMKPEEMTIRRGLFLVLDGVDGAGKTTQLDLLEEWLLKQKHTVVRLRDPGGTAVGERIRTILLDPASHIAMNAESLLYLASRAQLVAESIRPALERGETVLCDRFELSTIVYQGVAGGVDADAIRRACELTRGDCVPDWTGILDLDPAVAAARSSSERDRIERRGLEYHQRVREGFRQEALRDSDRVSLIDAGKGVVEVHRMIRTEAERVLARRRS
jgi:dTMP kinase